MSNKRTNPFYEIGDKNPPISLFNEPPSNEELHEIQAYLETSKGKQQVRSNSASRKNNERLLKWYNEQLENEEIKAEINFHKNIAKNMNNTELGELEFELVNAKVKRRREEKEKEEATKKSAKKFGNTNPFPSIPGGKKSRRKTKNKKSKKSKTRKMKKNKKSKSRRR